MDILDRLLGHDEWTTRLVLDRCRELTPEQLLQPFDIGHETLDQTLQHMIGNIEVWTALMRGQPVRPKAPPQTGAVPLDELRRRFDAAYADFAAFARQTAAEGRLDATYVDVLDIPPTRKTFGGTIAHVITHDMLHRGELLHMLQRLGLRDLPEGDLLGWEAHHARG